MDFVILVHKFIRFFCENYTQVVEVPNVSWEDIGGLENVKRELQEVIDFNKLDLMHSYKFRGLEGFITALVSFHVDCSIPCGAS